MALVLAASFLGSIGAGFLKSGAVRLTGGLRCLVLNYRLALGIFFFCASSVLYVMGVRHGQLSVLYPLVSLSYIWAMIWSRIFLHERLSRNKLLGLSLILLGIVLVGLGNR
jgi:drug/metabolite transporter (DMT)-like permease